MASPLPHCLLLEEPTHIWSQLCEGDLQTGTEAYIIEIHLVDRTVS